MNKIAMYVPVIFKNFNVLVLNSELNIQTNLALIVVG